MIRKRGNIVGKKEKASGSKKPLEMQHEILTEEEQEYVIDEIKEQSEKDLKQITIMNILKTDKIGCVDGFCASINLDILDNNTGIVSSSKEAAGS
ncbi:hypothetical protein AX774_g125 [Zancudomyces culisetae]|uniref:Uncharacterized protein n=1 Tax=Zancudomyces culisetae TaxID=1213189 RepID=A0A1R1PZ67_ZANCU|nr:hypothetical protein AX774_g125 [Zancudomyces culisetae]|eukprot:OMH86234.1 hypothetical protein AX774_g125 [Zancudomyces culisetae]